MTSPKKKKASRATTTKKSVKVMRGIRNVAQRIGKRHRSFMARRPHRSFRLTRRRDYARSLDLPGYVSFTGYVSSTLLRRKGVFIKLVLFYALAIALFGGITNQSTYTAIGASVRDASSGILEGSWGKAGEAGLLLVSAFGGGANNLTIDQQVYLGIALLFVWLTTVWLLRDMLAGKNPSVRDGLYGAGAPFLSTLFILLYATLQFIPIVIVAIAYTGLNSAGLIDKGFGSMLFFVAAGSIALLMLYWITSTIIAGVVVTLPGMYPGRALTIAGDLVVGRRMRILLRLLWMLLIPAIVWALIAIPMVLLDEWLGSVWQPFKAFPLMPIVVALLSAATVVWSSAYIYLLYRKIVDDDAKPA